MQDAPSGAVEERGSRQDIEPLPGDALAQRLDAGPHARVLWACGPRLPVLLGVEHDVDLMRPVAPGVDCVGASRVVGAQQGCAPKTPLPANRRSVLVAIQLRELSLACGRNLEVDVQRDHGVPLTAVLFVT